MASAVKTQRHQMISATVERIRLIEKDKGVTREALEDIRAVMLELAAHTDIEQVQNEKKPFTLG